MSYQFQESGTYFEAARVEYQNELERANALDTRLSISLPIISAYFFAAVQRCDVQTEAEMIRSLWDMAVLGVDIFLLLTAGAAFVFLVSAVLKQENQYVDVKNWDTFSEPASKEDYSVKLAERYLIATEKNRKNNRARAMKHTMGWFLARFP